MGKRVQGFRFWALQGLGVLGPWGSRVRRLLGLTTFRESKNRGVQAMAAGNLVWLFGDGSVLVGFGLRGLGFRDLKP